MVNMSDEMQKRRKEIEEKAPTELKYFPFYTSFYEQIFLIEKEKERQELLEAVLNYAFLGELPNFKSNQCRIIFVGMKPNIDKVIKGRIASFINGSLGGAPKGNQNAKKQPKNNLKTTQKQPKNNLCVDYSNRIEIEIEKEKEIEIEKEKEIEKENNTKGFYIPSADEVYKYIQLKQYTNVNALAFINQIKTQGCYAQGSWQKEVDYLEESKKGY